MLLKITTPVPSSRLSLSKKLKNNIIHIRGSSQTPTLRKKFSPHLNKSFNCYEEPSVLPSYNRQSPNMLRDSIVLKRPKNRIRITSRSSTANLFSLAKAEMTGKNYLKALDLLNKVLQEENNPDILYSRGVCLMHLKSYPEALIDLKQILESFPLYDPQLYIALYMCYLHSNNFSLALKTLNSALKVFPKFSKAYLLRGQMMNKLKKYDKALRDFGKSSDPEVHLYIGESLKGKLQFDKAVKHFDLALQIPSIRISALLEKAKLNYKVKNYKESLENIEDLLKLTENNIQASYYLAKLKIRDNELIQSTLLLEQVIQNSNELTLSLKAICKLGLIKIKEKDFYGALHTFHRTNGKELSKRKQSLYQYTEAIVSLMKRKFNEGILIFNILIEENILKDYIISCFIYRAYGHYAKGDYPLAINDYLYASNYCVLDKASSFNYMISQAIVKSEANDFKGS